MSTYTARLFGGEYKIKATMDGRTKSATANLQVKVSGLQQLSDGANFNLVGSTAYHVLPNNHYGTSGANSDLIAIANDYANLYPASLLDYNDQSLPNGGLFDIGPPYGSLWQSPHSYHRFGTNCDVRKSTVPQDRWESLQVIFERYGTFAPEGDHWHLTL
jgi:hypothetical protein